MDFLFRCIFYFAIFLFGNSPFSNYFFVAFTSTNVVLIKQTVIIYCEVNFSAIFSHYFSE